MITVKAIGFEETIKAFRNAAARVDKVIDQELQKFGDESVTKLVETTKSNGWGLPPKKHPDGNPPLIDSGKYINGYVAVVENGELSIFSQGMNDHMSNDDLALLLEYGNGDTIPARPHLRPLFAWMETQIPKIGVRIADGLLTNSRSR